MSHTDFNQSENYQLTLNYLLPYEHFQDERNYKLYLLNCLFIFCKEASETITFSQGFQAAKIKDDN